VSRGDSLSLTQSVGLPVMPQPSSHSAAYLRMQTMVSLRVRASGPAEPVPGRLPQRRPWRSSTGCCCEERMG
jgi:hypothetical protein